MNMTAYMSSSLALSVLMAGAAIAQAPSAPATTPSAPAAAAPRPASTPQDEAGEPRADTTSMGDSPGAAATPGNRPPEGSGTAGVAEAAAGGGAGHAAGKAGQSSAAKTAKPAATEGVSKAASGEKGGARTDRLDLGLATVTGDHEQPKVLYIVPWKRADIGDLEGKPMNSLVDEVLSPVDRDVFKREVVYYKAIQADTSQNGAPATPAAKGEK